MKYIQAESTKKPKTLDVQKNVVYLRKDIVEHTEGSTTFWTYQEAKMSHGEFNDYVDYVTKRNAIKAVNDSENISNLLTGQENGDNNQLIIMEAIADLYDMIASLS